MDNKISILEAFEGKRNSVITLLVPPNIDFEKNMEGIERSVRAIKHKNKRGQIMKVLRCISEHNSEKKKFDGNGIIFCCGYTNDNKAEYYELVPPNKIEEFEYYYDYKFNVQRIKEVFNEDVIKKLGEKEEEKNLGEVVKRITDNSDTVVVGDREIGAAIDSKILKELYYLSDLVVPDDIIQKVRDAGAFIIKVDMDHHRNLRFAEDYGPMIGLLHYGFTFDLSEPET